MQSISVEYAADGVNYTVLGNVAGSAAQYAWTTPAQDIVGAKLRIVACFHWQESNPFAIRNSPPLFTMSQSGSQLITNQPVTYSGTCDTNFPIQVQITGQQSFQSLSGFQCNNGQWTYSFTPSSDNIYNFNFTES